MPVCFKIGRGSGIFFEEERAGRNSLGNESIKKYSHSISNWPKDDRPKENLNFRERSRGEKLKI